MDHVRIFDWLELESIPEPVQLSGWLEVEDDRKKQRIGWFLDGIDIDV
jgi:hypothetical protein